MLTSHPPDEFRLHCPDIDEAWPVASGLIQKALDWNPAYIDGRYNYTLDGIYQGLKSKEMQLWMWGDDAALVTAIQNDEEKRWCLLLALGGRDINAWVPCLPIVEGWAKENGCDEMRIYGRIGWARALGYDVEYTKLVRGL